MSELIEYSWDRKTGTGTFTYEKRDGSIYLVVRPQLAYWSKPTEKEEQE